METMGNVKKRIITSMIAIVLLIITLFGITYAYFIANLQGNTNDKSVSVTAGKLELIYDDEDSIVIAEKIRPGITLEEKVFSVKNTGTAKIDNYDVVLENVVNELKYYEDLTYILTCASYNTEDYESNGTDATEIGICSGNEGVFPKYDNTLVTNSIDQGITHFYTLRVTYKETYTDQSDDMKKQVSAKVNIEDNNYNLKKLMIYGNSIQEGIPSVDTPIEIQSVGDKTNNLFNKDDINVFDGTMSNGEFKSMENRKIVYIPCKEKTTYTISRLAGNSFAVSCSKEEPADGISYKNDEGISTFVDFNSTTSIGKFTTSAGAKYLAMIIIGTVNEHTEEDIINSIKIEEGTTATEYEPYGYKLPLTIRGKNLFDVNKYSLISGQWVNGTTGNISSNNGFVVTDYILCDYMQGKEIVLNHTAGTNPGIAFYNEDKTFISGIKNNNKTYMTTTVPENAIYLRFSANEDYKNEIQLEYGNKPTDYEPYWEPIKTNIYLHQPLRKVGDTSDYIDFANNKIVRYIEVLDDTGTLPINESYRVLEIPREEPIELPNLSSVRNNRIIEVNTLIEPSKIEY